jgi:PAS domain S-box-containing protein
METMQSAESANLYKLGEQLRKAEQRYEDLFEDAPVACHEIDQNGIVLRVNAAECELLGFRSCEMIGRPIWEFVSASEKELSQRSVQRKLSGEEPLGIVERDFQARNGNKLFLEIHSKFTYNGDGSIAGIRSFMVNMTERKRSEEMLQRQAAELSRSNAELEQFAYVASHDLQEPLRKIIAFGDRLRNKYGETLGEQGLDYITRMQNASARMQTLIQDLLTLSRVATQPRPFTEVKLKEVIEGVVWDLESRIEPLGGRVEIGPLPVMMADRVQVSQLFQNLIGNALKFHKQGEAPIVKVHAEGYEESDEGTWKIIVADNGIGFEPKHSERIFQIFQRLHGRGEYEGSGIGLSICRKIVDRHSGTIAAQSELGHGTSFTITFDKRLLVEGEV